MGKIRSIGNFLLAVLIFGIIGGGIYFIYQYQGQKKQYDFAERISEYGPRKAVPKTIEDLQKAISQYEAAQEMHIKTASQTGVYWKILSSRFSDKGMYVQAVDALTRAIEYSPIDETLHYMLGLNAAYVAKSSYANGQHQRYLDMSLAAYKRAIELAEDYTQAHYAIAVLYIYELNESEEGIKHLTSYMKARSNDPDAMMMMARAQYMIGSLSEAVDWYQRSIPLCKDDEKKREAENNIRTIRAMM
ncbi:MAG: tetratricopeptide repeat protein [Termitinemataceae bacterium]|nr:MAG: tetratricopeptide repeat protein [Termitinemataceae bacterium]